MSATPKPLYLNNDDLVREVLTYFDAPSDSWLPWTSGPATLQYAVRTFDAAGLAVYTPIAGLGPFSMIQLSGVNAGTWYAITPAAAINALASDLYVNTDIVHIVYGGSTSPPNLMAVQPRAVLAEYNPG